MYWKATGRSPQSLLFSRPNHINCLSLVSWERSSSPLVIFMASSEPAWTGPCLSRAGHPRIECWMGRWGGVEGKNQLSACWPCFFLCSPGCRMALWAASAFYWLLSSFPSSHVSKSFPAGLFSIHSLPHSVLILGAVPNQVWDLALGLVTLNEFCWYRLLKPMKA